MYECIHTYIERESVRESEKKSVRENERGRECKRGRETERAVLLAAVLFIFLMHQFVKHNMEIMMP